MIEHQDYPIFLGEIKNRIQVSQYQAFKAVNKELIGLYWDIGRMIVEKQNALGWGKAIVEKLSQDLKQSFPEVKGFSVQNLWYMRQLYAEYRDVANLQALLGEIGWTHHILIFSKCKDNLEREFYLLHTQKFGWSSRVLAHQIDNKTYEKYLLNQTNFDHTLPEAYKHQALLAIKDHYIFDFLELSDAYSERELELSLIRNVQRFLSEMGTWFAFVGSQYRLRVGEKEYFIDLLLYHRKLRSLVAIELKIGEFMPEYKGKMEFYLTALNKQVKEEGENDAIGIIICNSKDRTVVEYSLSTSTQPIGVATYNTQAELPENYRDYLPSAAQIAEKLAIVKAILQEKD